MGKACQKGVQDILHIKVDKTARLQPLSLKAEQVAAFELSRTFFIKL